MNHKLRYHRIATATALSIIALLTFTGCAGMQVRTVEELGRPYLDSGIEPPTTVIGFLGGRESFNESTRGVRRLALRLRGLELPGVQVETFANRNRHLAMAMVRRTLDRNRNGRLDLHERTNAKIILYGQSLGGWAVVKMARDLYLEGVPVQLSVQVDSVGFTDTYIPPNVRKSANLFQQNDPFWRGEPEIVAEDSLQTRVIANIEFDYTDREIDTSDLPFNRRLFPTPHTKMDADPEVWNMVENWILDEVKPPEMTIVATNDRS